MVFIKAFIGNLILLIIFFYSSLSQNELNVVTLDNPAPGYLFVQPYGLGYIGLTDNSGKVVHRKNLTDTEKTLTLEMQPFDRISYYANNKFYVIDNNFNLLDSFAIENGLEPDFHDFKLTTNGQALLLGSRYDTVDMSTIITGGKPNAVLISSVLQMQDMSKNVVWEWLAKDYFQVTDATSDVDLTKQVIQWVHANWIEIDYDGNILLSIRHLDEITKINKQTGEIIWRLGGKECKNNQFRFLNDTVEGFWGFSHQHSIHRLSNGNLLLFDNGNLKPTQYSRAVEYEIDEINKTVRKVWEYRSNPDAFSIFQGSTQRLPNGNTIIGWGTNNKQLTFTEVSNNGSIVMEAKGIESYLVSRHPLKMASNFIFVQNTGIFNFSDIINNTAVSLNLQNLTGEGYVSVERHYYSPHNISYETSSVPRIFKHRWVLNNKGINQFSGKIIFSLSDIDSLDSPEKNKIYWRKQEGDGKFKELGTTYNQAQGTLEANINSFGEFIIGEPTLFQPPNLITPTDNSKKNSIASDLVWHNVIGADSYKIQLSDNNDFALKFTDTLIGGDSSFGCRNLNHNFLYYWRVKSIYGSNESEWSEAWKFTTMLESPELLMPLNQVQNYPLKSIIRWSNIADATNYKINISESNDFTTVLVDETDLIDTSYRPAMLDFKTTYFWRVKALNFDNESMWSDTNSFTTEEKVILQAPTIVSPPNDTTGVPVEGYLCWESVGDSVNYNLELSLTPDFLTNIISESNIDSTFLRYNGLNFDTKYYWRVKGLYLDIESSWSEIRTFTTEKKEILHAPNLLFPSNDTIDVPLYGSVYWYPVNNAVNYNLELSLYPDFQTNIINGKGIGITSLYYGELNYDTTYYWHVASVNKLDTSAWSETWKFRTLKIEDVGENNINEFYLIIDKEGNIILQSDIYRSVANFTFIDITGRILLNQNLIPIPINISSTKFEKGIYFYLINVNNKIIKGKILVY